MAKLEKEACSCNCGAGVVAHILFVVGAFIFSKGILSATGGDAGLGDVLSSAVFWGIIVFLAGVGSMASAYKQK
ncbi:MAG: hypothetical protein AABX07_04915 [Nanoarchaeota archaeon]